MADEDAERRESLRAAGRVPRPDSGMADRTVLDVDVRELLHLFPVLSDAVATTERPGALLVDGGCYGTPSAVGDALVMERGLMALRVRAEGLTASLTRTRDGDAVLDLVDARERLLHRLQPCTDVDRLVLSGLARAGARENTHRAASALGAGMTPVRIPWEEGDQLAQIDAALDGDGIDRFRRLGRDYAHEVRAVDPRVVSAVFDHLCATGLPAGLAVFAGEAVQFARGIVHFVGGTDEDKAVVVIDQSMAELHFCVIDRALVVPAHGPLGLTTAIELYDADGRIVAMLAPFGIVGADAHDGWEALVAQIPRSER